MFSDHSGSALIEGPSDLRVLDISAWTYPNPDHLRLMRPFFFLQQSWMVGLRNCYTGEVMMRMGTQCYSSGILVDQIPVILRVSGVKRDREISSLEAPLEKC